MTLTQVLTVLGIFAAGFLLTVLTFRWFSRRRP